MIEFELGKLYRQEDIGASFTVTEQPSSEAIIEIRGTRSPLVYSRIVLRSKHVLQAGQTLPVRTQDAAVELFVNENGAERAFTAEAGQVNILRVSPNGLMIEFQVQLVPRAGVASRYFHAVGFVDAQRR